VKISWIGFLGKNHSWSIVGQNLTREFIKQGHQVDLFSTNGIKFFPDDLKPYLKGYSDEVKDNPQRSDLQGLLIDKVMDKKYDMQLSYTALKNFMYFFNRGDSNKFGIWNYETTVLPYGFAKYVNHVDYLLPSSNFSKKVFLDNGIREEKQKIVHHGIHLDRFKSMGKFPLKTKKKYKILANIAQPHVRKNIPGLLNAYGLAFTSSDDVCLVLKIVKNNNAGVSFDDIFKNWKNNFKSHGEVEIIDFFIDDIEPLYNACDVVITTTLAECFWMPGLEGFAANKIVVAPRYGGQLDYMNDENSILIDGKEIRAPIPMQYWEQSVYAKAFEPDVNICAAKLKDLINNYGDYHKAFSPKMQEILPDFTWDKVSKDIIKLCK
jgi:glycosyltransferase involved in cell wall biosynthesis